MNNGWVALWRQSAGSLCMDKEGTEQISSSIRNNRLEFREKRTELCICSPSSSVFFLSLLLNPISPLYLFGKHYFTKKEPHSLNCWVSPCGCCQGLNCKSQSPKVNNAAETKTHLDAEIATCSCPLLGPGAGRGWLLGDWEKGREIPVDETGSLCFSTHGEGLASEERKVKVIGQIEQS